MAGGINFTKSVALHGPSDGACADSYSLGSTMYYWSNQLLENVRGCSIGSRKEAWEPKL